MKQILSINSKFPLCFTMIFALLIMSSCNKQVKTNQNVLHNYFSYGDSIESGGVRLIPIKTALGEFKVWTKRYGNNPKIKILLLHGGPGLTHEYMECFETFFQREGFEFYEYDQLGSFFSDQPKDSSLWNLPRFVDEVEQVRKAIGGDSSNFYLLGHSWGGILAMQYALKYQKHLKGLIVADMMANVPDYGRYANQVLAKQMNPNVLREIRELEMKKDYDNPRYMELLLPNFYATYICRLKEWPDGLNRALNHANNTIYTLMQGPSEFGISGRLADWNVTDSLKLISVPTLFTVGKYDTMDPMAIEAQSKAVRHGRYLYCPEGSHCSMWDDQRVFMDGVIRFIKEVNSAQK